jgi:hypothetical protein
MLDTVPIRRRFVGDRDGARALPFITPNTPTPMRKITAQHAAPPRSTILASPIGAMNLPRRRQPSISAAADGAKSP